jgi:hypothetical protein
MMYSAYRSLKRMKTVYANISRRITGLFEVTGSTSKNNESLHGVLDGSTGIISGEEVIDSHLLVLILLI